MRVLIIGLMLALASPVAAQSVTLAWDPNPPADNAAYLVGYTEVPASTTVCPTVASGDVTVAVVPPASTTATVSLASGKTFCLRAYAVNSVGRSGPSNTVGPVAMPVLPDPEVCTQYRMTIAIPVMGWTPTVASGGRARVSFTLAHSFPITRVQALLGTQVVGEITGSDLRDVAALAFSVPRTVGSYPLFVAAFDNQGCREVTTLSRTVVVQ